jgi:hypothetical protein
VKRALEHDAEFIEAESEEEEEIEQEVKCVI